MSQLLAMLGAMPRAATPAFAREGARPVVLDGAGRPATPGATGEAAPRDVPAEFAALLAMLGGASSMMRTDLVAKLPAEEVALVDRLLDGQLTNGAAPADAMAAVLPQGTAATGGTRAGESMDYALRTLLGAASLAARQVEARGAVTPGAEAHRAEAAPGARGMGEMLSALASRLQALRPETRAVVHQLLATPASAATTTSAAAPPEGSGGAEVAAAMTAQVAALPAPVRLALQSLLQLTAPTPLPEQRAAATPPASATAAPTAQRAAIAQRLAMLDAPARDGLQALLGVRVSPAEGASAFVQLQARLAALEPAARLALADLLASPEASASVATGVMQNIGARVAALEPQAQDALQAALAADARRDDTATAASTSTAASMAAVQAQLAALSPAARDTLAVLMTPAPAPRAAAVPVVRLAEGLTRPGAIDARREEPGAVDAALLTDARLLGAMDPSVRATLDALASALEQVEAGAARGAAADRPRVAMSAVDRLDAAEAASAPAAVALPKDVTVASRDLDGVAPELRDKVQRVIDRMRQEYGHEVAVVEGTRSQERQEYLYAQGRTRPGAVVTWTRHSAHTDGHAVDVVVDGSWENPAGFARLQRIAREEGLRTLGMRDPGHLELMAPEGNASARAAAQPAGPSATGMAPVAGVAQVAGTAGVAGVAQVAAPGVGVRMDPRVAGEGTPAAAPMVAAPAPAQSTASRAPSTPASLGEGTAEAAIDARMTVGPATVPATPAPNTVATAQAPSPRADLGQEGSSRDRGSDRRDDRQRAEAEALAATPFGGTPGEAPARGGAAEMPHTPSAPRMVDPLPAAPPRVSEMAPGAAQATRVAELQDRRDAAPAAPLSRMTLGIEGARGGEDRITVELRGTAVDAHIATDAVSAERLRQRTVELQDALGRHGLEAELLRVSSNAPGGDAGGGQRESRPREEPRREQQGPRDEPRTRDQQDEGRRGRRNPYQERAG